MTITNTQSQRIQNVFADLKAANQKALVPFITTGDPQGIPTVDIMHALVDGGANMIELGIPFSDPAADGETIQHASERAIASGIGLQDTLSSVKAFRETNHTTPVILMGYLNPAEIQPDGFSGFANQMAEAGADAVILVDLSYESGAEYREILKNAQIDLVNLIAPTTTPTRLAPIVQNAGGFIYYVSMRGITGSGSQLDTTEISAAIAEIRAVSDLPVCVGFGISDGETAKTMAAFSDGVVVGSALVKKLYNAAQQEKNVSAEATAFMQTLRQALDN